MAEDRRIQGLIGYVEPGWQLHLGPERIAPDPTLLGSFRRGQVLLYRCQRSDCGRRVQPDLEGLVRGGHGHLTPSALGQALSCHHPLGCGLKLTAETYPRGVPLVAYLAHGEVLIAVNCEGCRRSISLPVRLMIDRLRAARRGGGDTGILELPKRIRGPCRRCGGRAFTTEVVWSPPRSGNAPAA